MTNNKYKTNNRKNASIKEYCIKSKYANNNNSNANNKAITQTSNKPITAIKKYSNKSISKIKAIIIINNYSQEQLTPQKYI